MSRNHFMEPIFFTPPRDKLNRQLFKGGGDAPSPDPQIGRAALMNAQLGQEAFDFYQQEYLNSKPAQERQSALTAQLQEQMIAGSKLNNQYAKDYYNYMQETFRPLEKSIVQRAQEYDTAGRREAEAAQGLSDVRQAFDTQRQMTMRNNERMGINPNSGNAQALNQQLDVAEAVAGANAMNRGRKNAEMTGNAMMMDAASLGRNLPSNQATSQQVANSGATGAVNLGLADAQNQRANLNIMGQGYGTAMQGYSNQANILNNQYQNQLAGWQAEQQNNAAGWSGLGTLAGVMIRGFKDGGAVESEENEPVEDGEEFVGTGNVNGKGTSTSDSIPARLSDGEFVINAEATQLLGLDVLNEINERGLEIRNGGKKNGNA